MFTLQNICDFLEKGFEIFINFDIYFNFKYLNFFTMFKIIVFGLEYFPSAWYGISVGSIALTVRYGNVIERPKRKACVTPTPASITCRHAALAAPIDRTLPYREHPWQASSRSLLDLAPTICQNTALV